ncbi:hypothetical protein [Sphingomonas sp. CROZ-RG-20F-R02-07]|uniref:hypothetical protein n=1 Tax=Sphingomonas sp. CROZ-RG-20F-R02-07 TaxID=2914832 RepID=UPI001F58A6FC|nr:hypothetical protein [Sphingomonas sp. CROZ-RG-20F-R02-07]
MRATYSSRPDSTRAPARRRAVSFALTIVAHILIILLLLHLTPTAVVPRKPDARPAAFQLLPDPQAAPIPSPRVPRVAKVKQPSGGAAPRAPRPPAPPTAPPSTQPPSAFPAMLGGRELFQAADVAKLPAHPEDRQLAGGDSDGAGQGQGKDSGSTYGPGAGPGGERLYNADWYPRPPSHAEIAGYMPPSGAPMGSWAEIACRTIENYHVENCRSLGESPVGSGLARAMREAAWQFRVRPPRVGGKAMVGAWVRIRIDFTEKGGD